MIIDFEFEIECENVLSANDDDAFGASECHQVE